MAAGNTFGQAFRITTFGESHGAGLGVIIDGCPAGLPIDQAEIQRDLDRRKPGQSSMTTQRKEGDVAEILSGVFEGITTGAPISMMRRADSSLCMQKRSTSASTRPKNRRASM